MDDSYSLMLVVWLFILLLGGCVLINAAIDLGARELRRWLTTRRHPMAKAPVRQDSKRIVR